MRIIIFKSVWWYTPSFIFMEKCNIIMFLIIYKMPILDMILTYNYELLFLIFNILIINFYYIKFKYKIKENRKSRGKVINEIYL